jgi:MoxR-like ATPase
MHFTGTPDYIATDDLAIAVNAAVILQRPLLVKGEPGTGKTELARQVALGLNLPIIEWHVKSTTKAQQGLYEYDAVSRLRDSQLGDARVNDVRNYIRQGKLWQAFTAPSRVVLLIDEVDKADIEFPNDLLQELDRMELKKTCLTPSCAAVFSTISGSLTSTPCAALSKCIIRASKRRC